MAISRKLPLSLILCFIATANSALIHDLQNCLDDFSIHTSTQLIPRNFSSPAYNESNFQWQLRGHFKAPMAFLLVETTNDVQAAVLCGRTLGLSVFPRGGGHGYTKYAYGVEDDRSLILEMRALKSVAVNPVAKTAIVEAGALQAHVAYILWANGNFLLPLGVCGSVGIAGYTLGGGISVFSLMHGVASDSVLELEMVDATGTALILNNITNSDLFWAMRGAGGSGSFGIVTKITFRIHTAPAQLVYGNLDFDFAQLPAAFSSWQSFMNSSISRTVFSAFEVSGETVYVRFIDVQDKGEAETIGITRIEEIFTLFPPANNTLITPKTYEQFLVQELRIVRRYGYLKPDFNFTQPSDLLNVTRYGLGTEWFKAKSFFAHRLLTQAEIGQLSGLYAAVGSPDLHIYTEAYGGQFHTVGKADTAYVHRGAYYIFTVYMVREHSDDEDVSQKLAEFFEATKPVFGHTTSYQNYVDDEMDDALERYYGTNLPRLIDIKTKVDPGNFFYNPQSIPVAKSVSSTSMPETASSTPSSAQGLIGGFGFTTLLLTILCVLII